ncbi:hypothetical protein GTW66_12795 [Streptomyces sp. SID5473]|nr:hypothetical protein [Streptomyces sp. SID5473]
MQLTLPAPVHQSQGVPEFGGPAHQGLGRAKGSVGVFGAGRVDPADEIRDGQIGVDDLLAS